MQRTDSNYAAGWAGGTSGGSGGDIGLRALLEPAYAYLAWDSALKKGPEYKPDDEPILTRSASPKQWRVPLWRDFGGSAKDAQQTEQSLQPIFTDGKAPFVEFAYKQLLLPAAEIRGLINTGDFSLHARFAVDSPVLAWQTLFSMGLNGSGANLVLASTGAYAGRPSLVSHGGGALHCANAISAGAWVDCTISFIKSARLLSLSLNGYKTSLAFPATFNVVSGQAPQLGFGLSGVSGQNAFAGKVNRFLFFKRALSDRDEAALRALPMR